jgi:hypothetical protein
LRRPHDSTKLELSVADEDIGLMSTTATQRRPMRAVPAAVPHASHHVFPVRFTPASGLSAVLLRPQNSYHWIGAGSLLVDEHGVRVTARRLTLLGLYRTVLFILPSEIREVYREGDSIRVDLQTGTRHDFFRLWAESANAAAEIVARMPTSRTIELEAPTWSGGGSSSEAYRSALWLALAVLIAGALGWVGVERLLSNQGPIASPAASSSNARGSGSPAPASVAEAGSRADALAALSDLEKFTPRFDVLSVQFGTSFTALQRGTLSQDDFVSGVEKWLLPQWEELGAELVPTTSDPKSLHATADTAIRGIIDNWHLALMAYAHGLRLHDSGEVFNAFNYIKTAEAYQVRARELYDKLDAQR